MNGSARRRGFTLVEFLVVVAIIVIIVLVLVPAVNQVREAARLAHCNGKMKQHVLSMHNYHDRHNGFPPTSVSTVGAAAPNTDGYSFFVEMLPYLECLPEYNRIQAADESENPTKDPLKNPVAAQFQPSMLLCPSYAGPQYLDEKGKRFAITNYKAMSATHKESLACATDPDASPKYGDRKQHPDGGILPLVSMKLRDLIDGTSNTILLVETMDETGSYWAAGSTISLVALPSSVSYVLINGQYWAPAGFVPRKYDDEAKYDNPATYFHWDYAGRGVNAGTYDTDKNITHGPSSPHPSVIQCGFGDGNARSVSKNIDQALLKFIITRAGNDPSSEYFARSSGG